MILRGIDFGRVWAASGALGFFGEGYWFHRLPWLDTTGMTFVAKTVTTDEIVGNMPIDEETWQPREWQPRCIWFNLFTGIGLNAVGLSNFGIRAALDTERWQARTEPFMLSWMPMGKNAAERLADAKRYVTILKPRLKDFNTKVALQLNISCPNTDENLTELLREAAEIIKILHDLDIPIIIKINVLTSPQAVRELHKQAPFDAVCVSNTIPFGELADEINWHSLTGTRSPLQKRGLPPGGLSGSALYPHVQLWVMNAICTDLKLPLNWCGGIMSPSNACNALASGCVQSISLGTILMLRPWRVQASIQAAKKFVRH